MRVFLPALVMIGIAVPVLAQQGPGIRGGISVDPDQVYFGGHFETDALVDRLHFRPNVELGVGDNAFTTAINFEFIYKFPSTTQWLLYTGGGPGVNFYRFDDRPGRGDETITEGGLNVLFGVENRSGLFFEAKIGAFDSPDVRFGVGWTFR